MDRISELPDSVLHHILSLLPTRDSVRTSALSRRWNRALDSFPFWDFDDKYFWRGLLSTKEEASMNCVNFSRRSLGRLRKDGIGIPRVKFNVTPGMSPGPGLCSSLSDCIDMAVDGQVKELTLHINGLWAMCVVPQSIFASRSLTVLVLYGCRLQKSVLAGQVGNRTLRELSLFHVEVCETALRLLFNCFPSVEDLFIKYCFPVCSISVSELPKLKVLNVRSDRVEIDAPSLRWLRLENAFVDDNMVGSITAKCPLMEYFALVKPRGLDGLTIRGFFNVNRLYLYKGPDKRSCTDVKVHGRRYFHFRCFPTGLPLIRLGVDVCRQLKEMEISGVSIDPDHLSQGFISRCPLLEKLCVSRCPTVTQINISSLRLKTISLGFSRKLEDIRIEAPQLQLFHYSSDRAPSFSVHVPCPLEFELKPVHRVTWDDSFFLNLNALLSHLDQNQKVKIKLFIPSCKAFPAIDISELRRRCVSLSRNLDQLRIVGCQGWSYFPSLVDALLWSCQPRSLWVCLGFPKEFLKVLYEKIIGDNLWNVEMKTLALSSKRGKLRSWNLDTEREPSPPLETFVGLLRDFRGGEAHFRLHWSDMGGQSG